MKQLVIMAVLVCVFILAGCGSASENMKALGDNTATTATNDSGSSSNDGQNKEGQTNESSTKETEKATEVKEVEEGKEAEEAKAAKDANETKETNAREEKEQPKGSKQTKEVNKAIAANKAANTAVVGSIMSKDESKAAAAKDTDKAGMEKAVKEIRSLAKDLKQKAEAGDADGVKAIAGQTIQAWDAVKSDIEASAADMYPFLDEIMTKLAEQTKAEEVDMEAIIQIDYQIYQGFRQLAEKLGIE